MLEFRETKMGVLRLKVLKYGQQFMVLLWTAINENTKKYKVRLFKKGVPEAAILDSAGPEGVVIKEGSLEQKKPWSYFPPFEVSKIAQRQLGFRNPMKLFVHGLFVCEMGDHENGMDWIRNALAKDEFGEIQKDYEEIKEYLEWLTQNPRKLPKPK
jgi:hypothetical protein